MRAGLKLEHETIGTGREATREDIVVIRYEIFLNRRELIRADDRYRFGVRDREVIAGLRYGVEGMRVGGRRRFRVPPHLAYRDIGVPGLVPPNAVLIFDVTLLEVRGQEH
jgi:FKBP-type peptidyl-prolyl cis-trans isomerase FkpA